MVEAILKILRTKLKIKKTFQQFKFKFKRFENIHNMFDQI